MYLRLALRALVAETGEGEGLLPALEALIKAVFLDMSLAMSTYIYGGFVQREIATELERAAQVAEQALQAHAEVERAKDELSRMVVHDLKNPVSGIAMVTQLALRKGKDLPEAHRGYLRQIDRTCREMMRLIQNLLEIAKIEEEKMPVVREPVSLAELADEVVEEYAAAAEQSQQAVRTDVRRDLPPAVADRWLLRRVLINLVVNAIRHGGGREVQIDAAVGPGQGEITLRVIDSGRGIAAEDQDAVFERFRSGRRSAGDDPATDTGLGLPFCKLALERMGGRIALTSRPGETVSRSHCPLVTPPTPDERPATDAFRLRFGFERGGRAARHPRSRSSEGRRCDRWQPSRHLGTRNLRARSSTDPGRGFARVGTCSGNARDFGDFVLARGLDRLSGMLVRDLMQREVTTLKAGESLGLAEDIMQLGRIRHLPVLSGGVVVGIVSQRDLYRAGMSCMLQFRRSVEREWLACIPVRAVMTTSVSRWLPTTPSMMRSS